MHRSVENARDYLRLVARLLWQPGIQRTHDLSDVVQQTLLKAHKNIDQFLGNTEGEWRRWLCKILQNELFQIVRKNPPGLQSLNESSRRLEEVEADHSSPSERAMGHEEIERLAAALGQMPEDERTAVELKHLHGCSVAFISQHMGRTGDAVGGLLKRGMHRLRLLLQANGDENKG